MMPNTPLAAAPLIARSGGYRSQSAPFAAVPQQPRVLARAAAPQQLTLFGPPGGRR
jgi:hypothetical protein